MSETLERIRALRRELDENRERIENLRNEKITRLSLLCSNGVVPEHESCAMFEERIDAAAAEGERIFRQEIGGFLRPRHQARNSGPSATRNNPFPNVTDLLGFAFGSPGLKVNNSPQILAFLLRDQLIEAGRGMIHDAVDEAERADRLVPDAEAREAEIQELDNEIDKLTKDADAIRSELAEIGRGHAEPENTGRPRVYSPDDD